MAVKAASAPVADIARTLHNLTMTVHNPRRAGRLARRSFSAAFMSDTKWRKLIAAVHAEFPQIDQMLVKFIDVDEQRRMNFPPGLRCPQAYVDTIEFGPVELRAIEWLELPADISRVLERLGQFPVLVTDGKSRIVGYDGPIPSNVR